MNGSDTDAATGGAPNTAFASQELEFVERTLVRSDPPKAEALRVEEPIHFLAAQKSPEPKDDVPERTELVPDSAPREQHVEPIRTYPFSGPISGQLRNRQPSLRKHLSQTLPASTPTVQVPSPPRTPSAAPPASSPSTPELPSAGVLVLPEPLPDNPSPKYPPEAEARRLQGVVELLVTVLADGTVQDATMTSSSGVGSLDRAALNAVRLWKFSPGRLDGIPTQLSRVVRIEFRR
jgi:protein TonB